MHTFNFTVSETELYSKAFLFKGFEIRNNPMNDLGKAMHRTLWSD